MHTNGNRLPEMKPTVCFLVLCRKGKAKCISDELCDDLENMDDIVAVDACGAVAVCVLFAGGGDIDGILCDEACEQDSVGYIDAAAAIYIACEGCGGLSL